jgi:hypothetical protein
MRASRALALSSTKATEHSGDMEDSGDLAHAFATGVSWKTNRFFATVFRLLKYYAATHRFS